MRIESTYDRQALEEIHAWKNPALGWFGHAMKVINRPLDKAGDVVLGTPGGDVIKQAIQGLTGVCNDLAGKKRTVAPLKLFGQEFTPETWAMANMNLILHNMEGQIGDTFKNPKFRGKQGKLRTFDRVVANSMWNQDWFIEADYDNDELDRQWFVDHDLIESVLYLPENLFYNTTAPGIVLFLNRDKPKTRQGQVFLVNASQIFEKGDPKNFIPEAGIQRIADTLIGWKEEEKLSRTVRFEELKKNDYNISPSRYIHTGDAETYRPSAEIVAELDTIETEAKKTDKALRKILKQLGV